MENRLFEVKVFDANGNEKGVLKTRHLRKRHWDIFEDKTKLYKYGASMDYLFPPKPPGTPENDDYFK